MQFSSILKYLFILLISTNISFAQTAVRIDIDLTKNKIPVSPFIYGKNGVLPSTFLSSGTTTEITKAREAGVRFVRQSGGNNSTKYNWRNQLSSHPDWYNNVYANNWDNAAKNLLDKMPGVEGMWSFQLIGKSAANAKNNFNDWAYNQSQWWVGLNQNLAGGGQPNKSGTNNGKALVEGNPALYTMDWPADSTVGILDQWFGPKGLGYDKTRIRYWDMDNEPEIWSGTHDDVMPAQCTAEEFMQLYFKVAKAARAKYPDIKLVGPVTANEWQWYRYGNDGIPSGGKKYCWLEFFIKRISEEEKATGIRLLDVIDLHYYPGSTDPATCLQFHRVFFDRNYVYPEANGVHTLNGGWDTSISKEYVLGRCADWLTKYIGVNHGVGLAITETGMASKDANVQALWYASTMGEFMKNGVTIFTPWSWDIGMWEALHLFSRYNQKNFVQATSQDEILVSAYPTTDVNNDSLSVVLINRSLTDKKLVNLNFTGYVVGLDAYPMYSLSKLGTAETFVSHAKNALVKSTVLASLNQISVELAPMSVNTILLRALRVGVNPELKKNSLKASVYPNPANDQVQLDFSLPERSRLKIDLFDAKGQHVKTINNSVVEAGNQAKEFDLNGLSRGFYWIRLTTEHDSQTLKLIKND